jgi:hypothetical protein
MGQKAAALALMCQNSDVADAMATAGTPCPGKVATIAPAAGTPRERVQSNPATSNLITLYPTSTWAIDRQ